MSLCILVRLPIAAAYFFLLLGSAFAASRFAQPVLSDPETLAFDNVVVPGNPDITGLEIGPWLIASQKFHSVSLSDAGLLRFANNGSPFSRFSFHAAEGFLDDILAAEARSVSAAKLEVEAVMATQFTVTLEFDLNSQRDGAGGVADFVAFAMPNELQNVTSITFTGLFGNRCDADFAIDNFVVAAIVPEPVRRILMSAAGGFL